MSIERLTYDQVTEVLRAHDDSVLRFRDRYRHIAMACDLGVIELVKVGEHMSGTFTIGDELRANADGQLILPIAYGQEVLQAVRPY